MNVVKYCLAWTQTISSLSYLVFLCPALVSLSASAYLRLPPTVSFVALNPAINIKGLLKLNMRLVFSLLLILCIVLEREERICKELRVNYGTGNWATGSDPVDGDVCKASSFLGFPIPGQEVAVSPEAVVRLVSKESEFPAHILPQNWSGRRTISASSGSFPADTLSHPQQGVSVVTVTIAPTPLLSTHPWADSTKVWVALDLTGQYQREGYLMTLKRGVKKHFLMLSKQWHYVIIPLKYWSCCWIMCQLVSQQ